MALEIDVQVVMNGTKITGSVFLILQNCIDFNNILISLLENLLMYLKTYSLLFFFQQDILSGHTANNSVHCRESVYVARHTSSECSLTFARFKAMSSNCTGTRGAY